VFQIYADDVLKSCTDTNFIYLISPLLWRNTGCGLVVQHPVN
jgi:hypothetical protein